MGKRTHLKNTVLKCASCARANVFDQPYLYHAGFSDQGFLYNDAGNRTLTWSCYDPAYAALVGGKSPWSLTLAEKQKVEEALLPAPKGGRLRFSNLARCLHCGAAISDSIERCIYYLLYDGSIQTQDLQRHDHNFGQQLRTGTSATND